MKKLLAIILSVVTVFALVACGGSTTSSDGSGNDANQVAGETYDTGAFKIAVPDGWKAFESTDAFGEQDADGNYPVNVNMVYVTKGGQDDWDILTKPTITVTYQEGFEASEQAETGKLWYDETSDIDVSINGTKCYAFEAKSESYSDDGGYYVYDVVFYPLTATDTVEFTIPIDMIDFEGVSITDADVVAIMESFVLD